MGAVTRRRRSEERTPINDTEEETPRRRRRDEEAEETPRRRRRDEEAEETPRRRRRVEESDEDLHEEEERPARRRASKVKDEPKGRKSGRSGKSGWGSVDDAKEKAPKGGDYADDLDLPKGEEVLLKFGEAEPFDVFFQHWIERKGKRSFTCAEEDDCPLCEVGDRPSVKVCFNVISLADPDKPALKRWVVGSQVADVIKEFAEDKKTSPLNREDLYFAVKRFQKDKRWTTTVTPVKARDLDEDFDIEPLTEDEIDDLMKDAYDWESTEDTPMKLLNDVADEISGS